MRTMKSNNSENAFNACINVVTKADILLNYITRHYKKLKQL